MTHVLSHITFVVRDLDRMERIVTGVLKARKVYDSGEKMFSLSRERFFLIGEGASAIWLAIMEGEGLSQRSYNHVAFKIDPSQMEERLKAIEDLGLELKDARSRIEGEGQSIYFYDDDNHLFELHTGTLEERLAHYAADVAR